MDDKLINILKALGHKNRLRILNLVNQKELCVCELRNIMDVNQSNISRHLAKLRNVKFVKSQRKAQWVYYSLNQKILKRHPFLQQLLEKEIKELEICKKDNKNLKEYNESDLSCEVLDESNIFKHN